MGSDSSRRFGTEFDVRTNRRYSFYEQDPNYTGTKLLRKTGLEAQAATDQNPIDRFAATVRVYDASAFLAAEQDKTPIARPITLSLGEKLPPILNSVQAHFSKSGGTGTSDHLATNMFIAIANAGSGSLDPRSSAQASASIIPGITWDIDTWHQRALVDGTIYEFTDASGLTNAQIIARLLAQSAVTVEALPKYKTKSLQVVLKGQQVALQQAADSQASISVNLDSGTSSASKSKGGSDSVEKGVNIRVETIPDCIFSTITISPNTDSQSVSVAVKANIPTVPSTGTALITGFDNEPTALSGSAEASVTFKNGSNTAGPTSPAALDTSKKYIVDKNTREDDLGTCKYEITVVDFAQYV